MIFWFVLKLELSIMGSASAAIGGQWKTSWVIYKRILALKEFSQSVFMSRKKAFMFELLFHCLL